MDTNTRKIKTKEDLDIAFDIRKKIFVEEQEVALEEEFDEFDTLSTDHILVYYNNEPVGTGRLRVVDGVAKLERICVLISHRKYGLGKQIIKMLEHIAREKKLTKAKLHGQTHAEGFYKMLGYETTSDVFMEDGIPHVLMVKELS